MLFIIFGGWGCKTMEACGNFSITGFTDYLKSPHTSIILQNTQNLLRCTTISLLQMMSIHQFMRIHFFFSFLISEKQAMCSVLCGNLYSLHARCKYSYNSDDKYTLITIRYIYTHIKHNISLSFTFT